MIFLLVLNLALMTRLATGSNCPGCTPLDSLNFDKVIDKFRVSLIKFDVAYPYGDKHEEFAKVSKDGAEVSEFFVGEVGIKDYGDRDNEDLAKRFGITKDDYPVVMLFVKNSKTGEREEIKFAADEEFTNENLKNFIRQNSEIYLPLEGCVEAFDHLADKIMRTSAEYRDQILTEAETSWKNILENSADKKKAGNYVKIMRRIVSEGNGFVKKETERVKKLLETKLSPEKKKDLQGRINILKAFTVMTKDEL